MISDPLGVSCESIDLASPVATTDVAANEPQRSMCLSTNQRRLALASREAQSVSLVAFS